MLPRASFTLLLLSLVVSCCMLPCAASFRVKASQKISKTMTNVHRTKDSCISGSSGVKAHNGSMWQGSPRYAVVIPSPTRELEIEMCCESTAGFHSDKFSIVPLGPSKSRKGQTDYLCAMYDHSATLMKGSNSSITAVQANSLPPPPAPQPPPSCTYTSAQTCTVSGKCFWHGAKCSATPPEELNCVTIGSTNIGGSLCISMAIFDSNPFTSPSSQLMNGQAAAALGNFNWSYGGVNNYTKVSTMPPQLLAPDGQVHYWSVSSGVFKNASAPKGVSASPILAEVTYEEIVDGKQTAATGFSYEFSGNALSGMDMSGPGYKGSVAGKTVLAATAYAFVYQMVFWPNVSMAAAPQVAEGGMPP